MERELVSLSFSTCSNITWKQNLHTWKLPFQFVLCLKLICYLNFRAQIIFYLKFKQIEVAWKSTILDIYKISRQFWMISPYELWENMISNHLKSQIQVYQNVRYSSMQWFIVSLIEGFSSSQSRPLFLLWINDAWNFYSCSNGISMAFTANLLEIFAY